MIKVTIYPENHGRGYDFEAEMSEGEFLNLLQARIKSKESLRVGGEGSAIYFTAKAIENSVVMFENIEEEDSPQ